MNWYFIDGINPEPWQSPEFSVGRKGGKLYSQAYKSAALTAYQEAVKEYLGHHFPTTSPQAGEITLALYFWRQLPEYTGNRGRVRKHAADATNLQKALEDAIQGTLIVNDRDVRQVQSTIVEQSVDASPAILIGVAPYGGTDLQRLRTAIKSGNPAPSDPKPPTNDGWKPPEDLF